MDDVTTRFNSLIRETRAYLEYSSLAGLEFAPYTAPAQCSTCPFRAGRDGLLRGWGGARPKMAFISAMPPPCMEQGQYSPFTGEPGQLLLKIIKSTKLEDKDLHLSFALRCLPPDGADPEAFQVACRSCAPLLREEIKELSPLVVLAMGDEACRALTGQSEIEASRGEFFDFQGIKVIPTYGLKELLSDKGLKRAVWEDIQLAMKVLKD